MKLPVPLDPSKDIDWNELLDAIPQLQRLATTVQDSRHHGEGDVWTHTKMVCEALVASPEYNTVEDKFVLFYAALLHDIAKATTTVVEPDGRVTAIGHSKRGAVDARVLLWRAGVPFGVRERICGIIANHQVPFYAVSGNRAGLSPEFIVRKLSWELSIKELLAVSIADMRGRICADMQSTLDNIELFGEIAKEEVCFDSPYVFADNHTRLTYVRSNGSISPDYPFFQEEGSKVTVLSGLPASGKDTWAIKHGKGLPVISFDDAREELGLKHGVHAGAAVHLAIDRAKELLRQKVPFIWNATHLSQQMRGKTLDLLYAYNAEVSLVYLEQPESVIKSRNSKRDSTLTNAAIDKMLNRWEVPLLTEAHQVQLPQDYDRSGNRTGS